jgi:ketosteroid isomerase-like protein
MGRLLEVLDLKHIDVEEAPQEGDLAAVDPAELCPPFAPVDTVLDREKLARKVRALAESGPGFAATRGPPVEAPVAAAVPQAAPESAVAARLTAWADAWAAADVKRYLGFYAADFVPEKGMDRATWERQRQQRIAQAKGMQIEIQNPVVTLSGADTATVEFRQFYRSETFADTTDKTLEMRKVDGEWRIVRERVRAVSGR